VKIDTSTRMVKIEQGSEWDRVLGLCEKLAVTLWDTGNMRLGRIINLRSKIRARFKRKRKNPKRCRRLIMQAVRERRFFLYLVAVKPFLILAIFLPWVAFPIIVVSTDIGAFMYWLTLVMKFLTFLSASAIAVCQILCLHSRFYRLMKVYEKHT